MKLKVRNALAYIALMLVAVLLLAMPWLLMRVEDDLQFAVAHTVDNHGGVLKPDEIEGLPLMLGLRSINRDNTIYMMENENRNTIGQEEYLWGRINGYIAEMLLAKILPQSTGHMLLDIFAILDIDNCSFEWRVTPKQKVERISVYFSVSEGDGYEKYGFVDIMLEQESNKVIMMFADVPGQIPVDELQTEYFQEVMENYITYLELSPPQKWDVEYAEDEYGYTWEAIDAAIEVRADIYISNSQETIHCSIMVESIKYR